jgi:hypothetical protein
MSMAAQRQSSGVLRRGTNLALSLSLALLVAAIIGVLLGRSAIAEINPVHYRPVEPVRAVPPPPPAVPDTFAQAYGWPEGQAALASDCGGDCNARATREELGYAFDSPPPARLDAPSWRDDSAVEPTPWPPGAVGGRRPVQDYAHYPIEEKPAGAEADAGALAPKLSDDESDGEE